MAKPNATVIELQPLHDRVHVKEREPAKVSKGGLIIPDVVRNDQKTHLGDVVRVGEGKLLENGQKIPLAVKPGDVVMYGAYAGSLLKLGGQEFKVLREDEIVAIVTLRCEHGVVEVGACSQCPEPEPEPAP